MSTARTAEQKQGDSNVQHGAFRSVVEILGERIERMGELLAYAIEEEYVPECYTIERIQREMAEAVKYAQESPARIKEMRWDDGRTPA